MRMPAAATASRADADGRLAGSGDVAGAAAEQAEMLVAGHGTIVAELFDSGQSRALPWTRAPVRGGADWHRPVLPCSVWARLDG
jgi:hypothetical protein